jgi:hypothetical protein
MSNYENAKSEIKVKCKDCGFEFTTIWNYLQYRKKCPKCYENGVSLQEREISSFIEAILPTEEILINTRTVISPKELDVYIPSRKIAIEYNGLWTHSEDCEWGGKDKNYHLNKTEECTKQGIQLIHIFEDEWLYNREIVKNRLINILNVNIRDKVYARKCVIKEIDSKIKNDFLEKFHIQGKDSSKIKLGAFYKDKLVSVMTFSHGNISKGSRSVELIWELNRFCSDYNYIVIGIASKFLEYFKRNFEWEKIFSYADRRWSTGNLYYKLGFELDHITRPNYWYIKCFRRIHRFNLRKPNNEKMTEKALRKSQGYGRIWDCGNLKFSILNGGK